MKIDWKIDYLKKTATCSQMTVSIIENEKKEPLAQKIKDKVVACGFTKIESNKDYFCLITDISSTLWNEIKKDGSLLSNFSRQLGDAFSEKYFDNPLTSKNQVNKICEVCHKPFLGTGKSKFCSNKCKQINKNSKKD